MKISKKFWATQNGHILLETLTRLHVILNVVECSRSFKIVPSIFLIFMDVQMNDHINVRKNIL
jgi:hypothetical protein